ncbi:MAG: RluA family pseudouridine synthase [Acidobacteriota bacterium]|nr:RluA family pseudouridine synthase [Acidobacteriota bacterium]
MSEILSLNVPDDTVDRLDAFLAGELEEVSRSKVKTWCKEGRVQVNGKARKGSFQLVGGEALDIEVPEEKPLDRIEPEEIPLDIVYEDDAIVVVNKPSGMVVHPGAGVYSGTLVHALAWHFENLSTHGGALRPGIVHRLDKGTTGLILAARTDEAHRHLAAQWQETSVTKVYQALVWGVPDPTEGELETHIGRHPRYRQMMAPEVEGGRYAKTRYKVAAAYPEAARMNVHILTGRTHQVRVHLAHLGHPVVGDALYGRNRHKNLAKSFEAMPPHPMLHAALLRFRHPATNEEMTFKQAPPADFQNCEKILSDWP